MGSNKVLEIDRIKNHNVDEALLSLERGEKQPKILNTLSSLALYKQIEDDYTKLYKLKDVHFKTLVVIVNGYVVGGVGYSISGVLRLHGYPLNYYDNIAKRLRTLVFRDLLEHSYNSKGHNVFVPTKKGISLVLSTIL